MSYASFSSSYMESELKKNGASNEQVYEGLFLLSNNVRHSNEMCIFILFNSSDMIRKITDFNKFTSKPNEFDRVKDHFIEVSCHWIRKNLIIGLTH